MIRGAGAKTTANYFPVQGYPLCLSSPGNGWKGPGWAKEWVWASPTFPSTSAFWSQIAGPVEGP